MLGGLDLDQVIYLYPAHRIQGAFYVSNRKASQVLSHGKRYPKGRLLISGGVQHKAAVRLQRLMKMGTKRWN